MHDERYLTLKMFALRTLERAARGVITEGDVYRCAIEAGLLVEAAPEEVNPHAHYLGTIGETVYQTPAWLTEKG